MPYRNLFDVFFKKSDFIINLNYTVAASFFPKLVPYLALPFLTSMLTTDEMGILGYLASILSIITIFIGFQPQNFFNVKWSLLNNNEKTIYLKSYLLICFIAFLVFFISFIFAREYGFFKTSTIFNLKIFLMLLCIGFSISFINLHHIIMQYENKMHRILFLNSLNILLHYAIGLSLIFYINPNWQFMFYGQFAASVFSVFFLIYSIKKFISFRNSQFSFVFFKKYLNFSYPLVFHGLGLVLMVSVDRIMIAEFLGLAELGIYSVAYMFGYIIGIFHDALSRIWSPYFYKTINKNTKEDFHDIKIKTFLYVISAFIVYYIFSLVAPFFFKLMVSENFGSPNNIITLVALGYTFESLRKIFSAYFFFKNKIFSVAVLSILGALINILLNFYLIPIYNINGAAYATLLTYIFISLTTFIFALKIGEFKNIFFK